MRRLTILTALALALVSTSGCGCLHALARFECWKWRAIGIDPCEPEVPAANCCPPAAGCDPCAEGAVAPTWEGAAPYPYEAAPPSTVVPGVQPGPETYAPEL